jgi:hypothetical protein
MRFFVFDNIHRHGKFRIINTSIDGMNVASERCHASTVISMELLNL